MVGILAHEANEVKKKWMNLFCCIRAKKKLSSESLKSLSDQSDNEAKHKKK